MDELDRLMDEYEERFGKMIPLKMVHFTEEELKLLLRKCLRTGKAYKLPDKVKDLMSQGVEF